jgi:hypothetical protein
MQSVAIKKNSLYLPAIFKTGLEARSGTEVSRLGLELKLKLVVN